MEIYKIINLFSLVNTSKSQANWPTVTKLCNLRFLRRPFFFSLYILFQILAAANRRTQIRGLIDLPV